jgi:hypothetical protein
VEGGCLSMDFSISWVSFVLGVVSVFATAGLVIFFVALSLSMKKFKFLGK